jgi:hypothetical protein
LVLCSALLAGSLVAGDARAAGVPIAEATDEQKAAAGEAYRKGGTHFDAGRTEEALAAFRASYGIVASPNTHFSILQALTDLGRYVEAYAECPSLIEEAEDAATVHKKYAETATLAQGTCDGLRAQIGLLTVNVMAVSGVTLKVADREIPKEDWGKPLPVMPGKVAVVLTTEAGASATREVELKPGARETVTVSPAEAVAPAPKPVPAQTPAPAPLAPEPVEPAPEPDTAGGFPFMTASLVSYGVGAAGAVMFAVFGGLTLSEKSTLEDQCPGGSCSPQQSGDADSGRSYQTVANVGLVVGAVGVAAGTGFLIGHMLNDDDSPGDTDVAIGPGSIMVRGSF